jgi:hypothetical protein
LTAGLLITALLPVAAAVSAEQAASPVPVAITQPLATTVPFARGTRLVSESGLLLIVGTGLLGLAAVMRRTMKA